MKRLTGRRDLLVLAAGLAVSTAGDSAALVVLLLRLRPAGSGWLAALLAGELIPIIVLAGLAGMVVDRFDSRRVLVVALIGQAMLAVPLAVASSPWATVLLFTGLHALSAVVRPATSKLVPAITGPQSASRGYATIATGASLGWIFGPAAGGLLAGTFGTTTALLLDALTFAVLAAATSILRVKTPPSMPSTTVGRRIDGGFVLLRRTPALRVALVVSATAIGCAVIDNVAAPFRFVNQLGATATGYGLYLSIWGAGAFLGIQILPRIKQHRHAVALAGGNLLIGLGIAGIGLAPVLILAFVAAGVGGLGNGLANVTQNALIAGHIPAAQHGRAFAAAAAVNQIAIGVGTAAASPFVTLLGANIAMVTAGSLTMFAAVGGLIHSAHHKMPNQQPLAASVKHSPDN
jgi:predicted MFS family arabinose efflux permease